MLRNCNLTEMDYNDYYLGGLQEDLRNLVQASFPPTLQQTYGLPRLHKATLEIIKVEKRATVKSKTNGITVSMGSKQGILSTSLSSAGNKVFMGQGRLLAQV